MRYTMILDDDAVNSLERLRTAYGLKTKADVYQLAMRFLTWATNQLADGHEIGRSTKSGDFQPLLMPVELNRSAWKAAANDE